MKKSVLLTSATGNVGSFIAQEMQNHGYQIFALCHSEENRQLALKSGYNIIDGDLTKPELWVEAIDQVDGIIHTACTFQEDMGQTDFKFIQSVVGRLGEMQRNNLVFVYTIGCWVHGDHQAVIDETTPEVPVDDFSWMKDNRDWLFKQSNLKACAVSPANVVNPKHNYVPDILHLDFQAHGVLRLPKDRDTNISLVSVEALASLYRLAFEHAKHGETYIGVTDPQVSYQSFAPRLTDTPDQIEFKSNCIDHWINDYGTWTEGYGLNQIFTSQKAIKELGWCPTPVYTNDTTD